MKSIQELRSELVSRRTELKRSHHDVGREFGLTEVEMARMEAGLPPYSDRELSVRDLWSWAAVLGLEVSLVVREERPRRFLRRA